MVYLTFHMIAPTAEYPYPQLQIATWKLRALFGEFAGWGYGMGYKVDIHTQGDEMIGVGPDGEHALRIDCSGIFRYLAFHATDQAFDPGDGSDEQHELIDKLGLKKSTPAAASCPNGNIYACFLRPKYNADGTLKEAGHVLMVITVNGVAITIESHGGVGCVSRRFDPSSYPFMGEMEVYVLAVGEHS